MTNVQTPAIVITKGIPLPVRKVPVNAAGRPSEYPWDKLEVGDAFPAKAGVSEKAFRTHASRMASQMRDAAAKGINPQFAKLALVVGRAALTEEQTAAGETLGTLYCWRVEDKEPRAKPVKTEAAAPVAAPAAADGASAAAEGGESTDETSAEVGAEGGETGDGFEG